MKILLVGGGTLGHIMPNVALLPYLNNYFDEICYAGVESGKEQKVALDYHIPFYSVSAVKWNRDKPWSLLSIPPRLLSCIREGKALLDKIQPDVVFSKGGYASLPVSLATHSRHIPLVIHESDYSMGLANKLCKPISTLTMTAFEPTAKRYGGKCVGIPLRDDIFKGNPNKVRHHYSLNRKTILVTGGSLGASKLNEIVRNALPTLTKTYDIIHLTGVGKRSNLTVPHYIEIESTDRMGDLISASDMVISRSGANTSMELLALGKKVLFVPLEKSGRGDQIENATYLTRQGYAIMARESTLDTTTLISQLQDLESLTPTPYPYDTHTPDRISEILYRIAKTGSLPQDLK